MVKKDERINKLSSRPAVLSIFFFVGNKFHSDTKYDWELIPTGVCTACIEAMSQTAEPADLVVNKEYISVIFK